jgi:hypothetical protein
MTTQTQSELPWLRTLAVRTRSRYHDYRWLGIAPPSWWEEFSDWIDFDRPSLVVRSDGKRMRGYFGRIWSSRVDRVSTRINYSIAVEVKADPGAGEFVWRLADLWMRSLDAAPRPGQTDPDADAGTESTAAAPTSPTLGEALDFAFNEEVLHPIIEAMRETASLSAGQEQNAAIREATSKVQPRLLTTIQNLSAEVGSALTDALSEDHKWHGSLSRPDVRSLALAHIKALTEGETGQYEVTTQGLVLYRNLATPAGHGIERLGRRFPECVLLLRAPNIPPTTGLPTSRGGQPKSTHDVAPNRPLWKRMLSVVVGSDDSASSSQHKPQAPAAPQRTSAPPTTPTPPPASDQPADVTDPPQVSLSDADEQDLPTADAVGQSDSQPATGEAPEESARSIEVTIAPEPMRISLTAPDELAASDEDADDTDPTTSPPAEASTARDPSAEADADHGSTSRRTSSRPKSRPKSSPER